jgi:hypothetical protein
VGGLNGRVRRLEGRKRQCPECGWPPAPGEDVQIVVHWADLDENDPDDQGPLEEAPEYCPLCGRPDEIIVRWLDLEEGREDEA